MDEDRFSGEPEAVWLTEKGTEDRKMRLLRRFTFRDPRGRLWTAPEDAVVDGASIPRVLWTIVGSPYTGDYRRASIVHDVACKEAGDDYAARLAADRMFFHACRAGGCSLWQATVLYVGVRIGAWASDVPAWQAAVAIEHAGPRIRRTEAELRLEADFQMIADRVLSGGETDDAEEIERRTNSALRELLRIEKPRRRRKGPRTQSRKARRAGTRRT